MRQNAFILQVIPERLRKRLNLHLV